MRLCLVCVVATLRRGLVEVHLNLLLAVLWYIVSLEAITSPCSHGAPHSLPTVTALPTLG